MIEVSFDSPDTFLKIRETLTRIGVTSTYSKTLWQTCHIFHKRGLYYIVHFKELLLLDGILRKQITEEDIAVRNFIVHFLESIGLLKVITKYDKVVDKPSKIKILKSSDKKDWKLKSKYTFDKKYDKQRLQF